MHKNKKIVIVAGEESGDIHASVLIKQLKSHFHDIDISGIGGQHMEEAGATLIYNLARYGVTGFTEVFRFLKILRHAFSAIKQHLKKHTPDLLILVDYPGFNLRLAKYAKKTLGIKIIYYISPQIWAWKAHRIHLIKECVDIMAVIFPFEKTLYEKAGVPVRFVGHPLVEKIPSTCDVSKAKEALHLPSNKMVIALLPGSRTNEMERHMPVLQKTAELLSQQLEHLHFIIPVAETLSMESLRAYFPNHQIPITFFHGNAINCMAAADFVIVASGTASLECALLEKPMCIIYKSSMLTYILVMKLIKIKFLGLCNLLANKMIVPEFLHYDCNPAELSQYILRWHQNSIQQNHMKHQLAKIREELSENKADCSLFDIIKEECLK